ncbi:retrovirus-related Pol polyprotein from transposon TNT 1-94 [Trichonephila clavipes]|nr:retrovirus-related Pol polyprotein from transposon TNT 1-94 [Trichonephila clavipes]
MEFKAHIEKLLGAANWSKWKRQIELLLQYHDVYDVCGDRKCPSLPAEASAEVIATHERKRRKLLLRTTPLSSCKGLLEESKPKVEGDAFVCTVEDAPESEVWIADSGASAHMTKHKNYFVDFTQFISPKPVYVGNSDVIMAYGHGTVNIEIRINSKWERHHLTGVKYLLKYALPQQTNPYNCGMKYCHQNKAHVRDILGKYQVKSDVKDSKICDGCCYGKQCRRPFGTRKQRATIPVELINIDVCSPMQQQSLGGAKFYVCFKDDFTKFCWVFFMQFKNEVSKCVETFLKEAKNAGHMVKEVLSDGGWLID